MGTSMSDDKNPTDSGIGVFLRTLSVNVAGGAVWAVLMTSIHRIQAHVELQPGNIVLLLLAGAVVGGIFSIGGFLIPWVKKGKGVKALVYDVLYGLAAVYMTVVLVLFLTALVLMVSGGSLPIKGNGGAITFLYMRDLINAVSPDYLLQLGLIPIIGTPLVSLLDLVKTKVWKHLKPRVKSMQKNIK